LKVLDLNNSFFKTVLFNEKLTVPAH